MTLAPLGDSLCSDPSKDNYAAAKLTGYAYDANTFVSSVPTTANAKAVVWRLTASQLEFIPVSTSYTTGLTGATVAVGSFELLGATGSCPAGTVPSSGSCAAADRGYYADGTTKTACVAGAACSCPAAVGVRSKAAEHVAWASLLWHDPDRHFPPLSLGADSYNPTYGARTVAACKSCATDFGATSGSDAGAAACTANKYDPTCPSGQIWDGDSAACVTW